MDKLPFGDEEFDIIWSEGAIYNIGFERGVKDWSRYLKVGGLLVVSEITWITASRQLRGLCCEETGLKEDAFMDKKKKLQMILGNLLLFAMLFGLVQFNKTILRPQAAGSEFEVLSTGSLPNFWAGFFISLAGVNVILGRKPKHGRLWVYLSSFLVFSILAFEEFIPLWGASTQFDYFDVFASGLGAALAIIIFEIIARKFSDEVH